MFLGMNSIYTPVYLPPCEYGQNQPTCVDVGLLLNMAQTSEWNKQVQPCMSVDFLKNTPLGHYTGLYI